MPHLILTLFAALTALCLSAQNPDKIWLFRFDLGHAKLPFHALVGTDRFTLVNGPERLKAHSIIRKADSLFVELDVFGTFLFLKEEKNHITGEFFDPTRAGNYRIKLMAEDGTKPRFSAASAPTFDANGTWALRFSPGTKNETVGLAEWHTEAGRVLGTIRTPTGDHRFLEGAISGDSLYLSAFDGSHLFLYQAKLQGDTLLGIFSSGNHFSEPFAAWKNPSAQLPMADTLTRLRPGETRIKFNLTDIDGLPLALSDARFKNKVVVVQLMGSWCPNCMDESRVLTDLYHRKNTAGLEVVAIGFERGDTLAGSSTLRRLRDRLALPYPVAYGGTNSKASASAIFPGLTPILAFPTTMIIDRKGNVRHIYTGFDGPATGARHIELKKSLEQVINRLLSE